MEDPNPKGTIVFTTVGRPYYGFDIFSVSLPPDSDDIQTIHHSTPTEHCLTDGISINYNGQFVDEGRTLVYVSERTGSSQIYLLNRPARTNTAKQQQLLSAPDQSLFHDRPIFRNGQLYYVSAHQPPDQPFKSWSAIYTNQIINHDHDDDDDDKSITFRLTPFGSADYSPAISESGKYMAVASYGCRPWGGEFHHLLTDIVVFRPSKPATRAVVCEHGGWPTWSGDSTIFFHRQAEDGWWSIFRIDFDLPPNFEVVSGPVSSGPPRRITPPGLHCFTPAVIHRGKQLAVATRRPDTNYRHIEILDVESQKFYPVTKLLNPTFHHYNPFVSPDSGFLGYHRFRGESAAAAGESSIIPHLQPVLSPIKGLRMLRLNGSFPSFSPDGHLLAFNHDFDSNSGLKIVRSDGSKRWTLIKDRTAFYNAWSPSEKHVVYTSIGPIFESVKATVQIARVSFDPAYLDNNEKQEREEEDIIIPLVDVKILTRDDTGNNAFPACSPDGKSLVFRSGRSGHKNLYIMDAVNGEFDDGGGYIRQLTDGPWIDTMPAWSPDGKLIAFSSNRHNPHNVDAFSIYVISPDDRGEDLRRIHVAGSEGDRERINHVCFSADGKWLLFTANIGGVTAEPVSMPNQFQPYGDLHVVRLDGSGLRRLTWNGYENGTPAWHPIDELEVELDKLCLEGAIGDKLKGQFDEPLWIHCDL